MILFDYYNMTIYRNKILFALGGIFITVFFLLPIISPYFRELFFAIINRYPFTAPLTIIIFRFLGVVIAPLPGLPVAFASMTLLPWWEAWVYNMAGTMSGAIVAFYIARIYRERVVTYIAPLQKVHEWQDQISQKKQWWTFVALRLVSLSMFDFVAYAAGLSKVSFATYVSTLLMIDIPISLAFFYFGGIAIKYSLYLFVGFALVFALFLCWSQYSKKSKMRLFDL